MEALLGGAESCLHIFKLRDALAVDVGDYTVDERAGIGVGCMRKLAHHCYELLPVRVEIIDLGKTREVEELASVWCA